MNDGLAVSTHHDSVTGTAMREVTLDYSNILNKS